MAGLLRRAAIFLGFLSDVLTASVTGLIKTPNGLGYFKSIIHTVVRSSSTRDPNHILRPNRPNTIDAYKAALGKYNLTPDIEELENDSSILWISRPSPSTRPGKVLLYFHGGGYIEPAYLQHVQVLIDRMKACKSQNLEISVAFLHYTLAPKGVYPVQLRQAAGALRYLVEDVQIAASDILIAGDSAGGNLALALLSHLAHPHPEITPIDLRGEKLGGAFLISPWVSFETSSSSMKTNAYSDYLPHDAIRRAARTFLGGAQEDEYNAPLNASTDWWQDLQAHQIGVLAAECEVFFDDIIALADKIKVHNPQVEVLVASREVHVQMVLDKVLRLPASKSEVYFGQWMEERLRAK